MAANTDQNAAADKETVDGAVRESEPFNSIIEVATELGIKVQRGVGRCYRSENHPDQEFTLFFNLAKNTFFCKICSDVGGSVADLVCQIKRCDQKEAADWLAHRADFDQKTKLMFGGRGKKKR